MSDFAALYGANLLPSGRRHDCHNDLPDRMRSRRKRRPGVAGYAINRSIDARLAVAALKAAIKTRRPPTGGEGGIRTLETPHEA